MSECQHEDTWFDRSICPEPCGAMHTICSDCGFIFGGCQLYSQPADDAIMAYGQWTPPCGNPDCRYVHGAADHCTCCNYA